MAGSAIVVFYSTMGSPFPIIRTMKSYIIYDVGFENSDIQLHIAV